MSKKAAEVVGRIHHVTLVADKPVNEVLRGIRVTIDVATFVPFKSFNELGQSDLAKAGPVVRREQQGSTLHRPRLNFRPYLAEAARRSVLNKPYGFLFKREQTEYLVSVLRYHQVLLQTHPAIPPWSITRVTLDGQVHVLL
jgi:hypothetical protein